MGTTARYLEKCHKSVEKLLEEITEENNTKIDIQRQILAEYKQMRSVYEDHVRKTQQQLTIANTLREERNKLLRELVLANKNKTD